MDLLQVNLISEGFRYAKVIGQKLIVVFSFAQEVHFSTVYVVVVFISVTVRSDTCFSPFVLEKFNFDVFVF